MSGGGANEESLAPPSLLGVYVATVCSLGFAAFVAVAVGTSWPAVEHAPLWPIIFLSVAAIVGELKPLVIFRRYDAAETDSTSAPFILALIAVGGVGVAVLVQALASLGDDLLNKRQLKKSAFNMAQ